MQQQQNVQNMMNAAGNNPAFSWMTQMANNQTPTGGMAGPGGNMNRGWSADSGSSEIENRLGEMGREHELADTFEVPKKYLGLLIGKQGDAIRKMREY